MNKCVWCELAGNESEKTPKENYVLIHKGCYDQLQKRIALAMEGLTRVQNLASHEYGEVYNILHDDKPWKQKEKSE